jgi:hypothetical protein
MGAFLHFIGKFLCAVNIERNPKSHEACITVRDDTHTICQRVSIFWIWGAPPACKQSMYLAGKSGFGNIYKQKDKRDPLSEVKKHWLLHSSCLEKLPSEDLLWKMLQILQHHGAKHHFIEQSQRQTSVHRSVRTYRTRKKKQHITRKEKQSEQKLQSLTCSGTIDSNMCDSVFSTITTSPLASAAPYSEYRPIILSTYLCT